MENRRSWVTGEGLVLLFVVPTLSARVPTLSAASLNQAFDTRCASDVSEMSNPTSTLTHSETVVEQSQDSRSIWSKPQDIYGRTFATRAVDSRLWKLSGQACRVPHRRSSPYLVFAMSGILC